MKLDAVFFAGETRLSFDAKPSADIRAALKRKGFQWYPMGQLWRRRVRSGDADFIAWLHRALAGNVTLQQMFDYYLGWLTNGGKPANHFNFLDPTKYEFAKEWGLRGALGMPPRVTFVFDKEGVVSHKFDSMIRFGKHVDDALATVQKLAR